jgi:ribonuclease HII
MKSRLVKPHPNLIIAGVDEAGRGPLAGPVVAASVIFHPKKKLIAGLADSKQLSAKERERLFIEIRKHALAWTASQASVAEIDHINILQATLLAMQRAVAKLRIKPQLVLIDGNRCPELACEAKAIIKGDETEPLISAASIVAKVIRDRFMMWLDKKYPNYGLAQHKGYSTQKHIEALEKHGPCHRIHRRTFLPVSKFFQKD